MSGRPNASTAMWILGTPQSLPSFLAATLASGCLLVGPHEARIEADIIIGGVVNEMSEDALPYAGLGPPREALVDGLPSAIALRQVVPVRAGPQHSQHTIDESEIVSLRAPRITGLAR